MQRDAADPISRSSVQRSAPFSMHSRGVPLLEKAEVLNCSQQGVSALRQVRDVGSAFVTLLMIQTWLTVFTAVMTIVSIAFFSFGPSHDEFPLDLGYIGFLIILPTLICTILAFNRREAALKDLSTVKSGLLFCWMRTEQQCAILGDTEAADVSLVVQQTIFLLLDMMRVYFLAPRFYASSYPYFGIRTKMVIIAQDRARQLRRINACFWKLVRNCKGCEDDIQRVHTAFERMSNVKEFRLPQALRAMIRICVPVVIPVFVGPFWAEYYRSTGSFAFALLIGLLLNLVVVAILNVAVALEDPFDNVGLDGLYCDEAFHEIEQNILMDFETELAASVPHDNSQRARVPPDEGAKMSRQSVWSSPSDRHHLPGGHDDTIKSERQNLSFVSIDMPLPLSTDP